MMQPPRTNRQEFDFGLLSQDLRRVAKDIPLSWGRIQNNAFDNELRQVCNIFNIMTINELDSRICDFDTEHQNYYRRRWYMLNCARCDEYLFSCNPGVERNPERKDKAWDIAINQQYKFDIKGTVIPKDFRKNWAAAVENPSEMVEFYYEKQSHGVRFDMQNRLFIVHHSLVDARREILLRCAWETKAAVYREFVENVTDIRFINYKNCTAAVIFLIETERGKMQYKISGLNTGLQTIKH